MYGSGWGYSGGNALNYSYSQPYSTEAAYQGTATYSSYSTYPTAYQTSYPTYPTSYPLAATLQAGYAGDNTYANNQWTNTYANQPYQSNGYSQQQNAYGQQQTGYGQQQNAYGQQQTGYGQQQAPKKPESLMTAEIVSKSMMEGAHDQLKDMYKKMKKEAKVTLKNSGHLDDNDSDLIDSEDEEFWQVTEEAKSKKKKEKNKRKGRDEGSHDRREQQGGEQRREQQPVLQQKQSDEEQVRMRLMKELQIKEEMKRVFVNEMYRRHLRSGTFELTEGTVKGKEQGWSAEEDCKMLRQHMKGLGTNEAGIIEVVTTRSNAQRMELTRMFKTMYGDDLLDWFKGDLSGKLVETVMALFKEPAYFDAYSLIESIYGPGTDEQELLEIMLTRTNLQITDIKKAYQDILPVKRNDVYRTKNMKLEEDIADDTSGNFKRLLVAACQANRTECSREQLENAVEEIEVNGVKTGMFQVNYAKLVDLQMAKKEAQALYNAGEKRWGTDESEFNRVLSTKGFYDLRTIFDEYVKISQRDIINTLDRELSGDVRDAMKAVVTCARYRPMFFAERLYKAIKGLGTDNRTLIRIIVSRAEIDLKQIKQCYLQRYQGETLWLAIENDCSGDFKKILQAIVGRD